jgi:fibronectin type 3 domain-containing protein
MRWNPMKYAGANKSTRRQPFRNIRLACEPLEDRVVPSTDVTAYHPAIPTTNPASTINAGVDSTETVLTPANVNSTTFGKLFATTVDGQVYAQPLYMSGLTVNAGTHNVVFVATEHDGLYAIDANSGAILWQHSQQTNNDLLTAAHGGTVSTVPAGDVGSSDVSPEIGITATPVIDPTNNTLFVETKQKEVASDGTHYEHYLYAIDITTGAIKNKVLIADSIGDTVVSGPSVLGTGAGSSGGVVKFDALRQMDRPGINLINGNIYLSYASHGDNGPYHGWILGYSESSLAPTAVFNANPNGSDDGIWQSGGTLAYETVNGNTYLYFETGNGTFDTTLTASPFTSGLMIPNQGDYGDAFVKVQIDSTTSQQSNNPNGWGMHVVDYFTPSNEGNLSNGDTDLGSGAPLLLPASAGSATHQNLMVGAGKEGRIYLIDRNNMGGYHGDAAGDGASGFDNVVQETVTGAINGSLGTPTFYNGVLYYVGGYGDPGRTFNIANGVMSSSSVTQSTDSYPFPGSTPTISTNNGTNAIVWDIAGPGTNQLRAYDASQGYSKEIYTSAQAANSRDSFGSAVKFTLPTVADGEVFVGTTNSLVAYGLLQQATAPPAAPSNLVATAFSGSVINLTWTDNDTAPNTATSYNILQLISGTYTKVGTASAGATSFAVGGLQVSTTYSFEVSATNSKGTSSPAGPASATTTSQASTLDFSSGFAGSSGVLTYNGSAKINGTSAELTDGGGTEAGSVFSTNAVDITKFSTQFTFQLTNASADGFTFAIQGNGPTALGATGGELGYQGIGKSIAVKFDLYNNNGEGVDSTGLFTNGADPTNAGSIDLTGTGIDLHSGDVFKVVMGYDGATLNVTITDTNTGASASQSYSVNIPQVIGGSAGYVGFTGGTGGATAVQNILTWAYSPTASTVPAAPSNLTGTVISGNEVDITWTDNSNNETGFVIDRSTDGGNTYSQIATVGANVTIYHDTSLSPGQTVFYKVAATNAAGTSAFTTPFQATVAIPPAPPTNLQATNITTAEVDLSWTNVATNATGIKILDQVGNNSPKIVATGLAPTTTSYKITGLTPGTAYVFEIDALNSSGPSGAATLAADTLPGQVTGVTATGGPGQITIAWAADQGAVTYNVYRSTTTTFAGTPTWSGITGTSYIDATATPGTTYNYEVSAVDPKAASPGPSPANAAGESAKSAVVSAVAQTPPAGINFGSGFAGATGLTLNGGAMISGSNLQLTDGGGTEARSAFDNTAQAIGSFSTQFTFQITAGSSPTADGFTFTIQGVGPTALGPSGGGLGYGPDTVGGTGGVPTSVAIKFDLYSNAGEGVDSTGLYMNGVAPTNVGSLDMTGSLDLHSGDVMQVNLTYDGSNLTETIKDTVTGGTFTHTYTGVNIAGTVGASTAFVGFTGGTGGLTAVQNIQTWTFTPGSTSTLGAPSNLVGVIQNGPQVQLTWNDNSTSETGFTIQRATDVGFTQNVTTFSVGANSTATDTFTDTSTVASTTYFYRVQAVQGSTTTSAFSNTVSEAIPAPPATPSNGHATLITETTVNLAWTNNATNADVYKIFREVVGGAFTQIASLPGNATSFNDSGLTPGTNYDYHIEAWNVSGNADRTGANLWTVSPQITTLAATAGTGQVSLSWTAPPASATTTYSVYRGTSQNGEAATAIATGLTTTSYTDTNVTAGTTYYYKVTSVDSNSLSTPSVAPFGESVKSNEASAAPTAATGFSAHINFTGNFQSGATPTTPDTVAGYINDIGKAFGSNGGGLTFGWNVDNTANGRDRQNPSSPDELHDSLIHMNLNGTFTWSIAVPNGTYSVHVVTGDPSNTDVVSKLTVNGVLTVNGSNNVGSLWLEGTSTITVTNGFITLAEQAGAYDKVDYIDITSTGTTATAPSITTQPASQTVTAGQSVTFSVVATGTAPLSYQWQKNGTVIGGANSSSYSISAAQASDAASYTVVVSNSAGSVTSSAATLTVNAATATVLSIDTGGAAAGSFVADTDFAGGSTRSTTDTISTTGVANAAPAAVYQSQRYSGPFTYTIPGLTAGAGYTVRLHFAEFVQNGAGLRTFNVAINGTTVLANFDVFATAGGFEKALVEQFNTTADSSGNITITFTNGNNNAIVSGIEVLSSGLNFANGFAAATGLTLNGTAKINGSNLQLTDTTANNEAGSAFSSSAVGVGKFTTTFSFQSDANPTSADGFAFVIQSVGATVLGPSGGGLGYGPDAPGGAAGIGSSIAVKFDLYNNAGEGLDSTGLFTNGQSPTTGGIAPSSGSLDFSGTLDLHSGHVFTTTVSYDGTTLTVKTTDTTTNASATQTYLVNIPGIVGGSSAFVGFTGGTGGLLANQNILSWTFTPQ